MEINKALEEFNGPKSGIKRRQLFDDIRLMESDQGWAIPLKREKEGRKVYYRYSDSNFSISNRPLNVRGGTRDVTCSSGPVGLERNIKRGDIS